MDRIMVRSDELKLTLHAGTRQAQRDGWPAVDFGGKVQLWNLLWALAQRHPVYFETRDLRVEIAGGGYVIEEGSLFRAIYDVKQMIKALGLTVANERKVGYRLALGSEHKTA